MRSTSLSESSAIAPPRGAASKHGLARLAAALMAVWLVTAGSHAGAIEMFTYFGDGSRIGLPNLEVPIEAYPGIPLRSDRLRARRRAMQGGPGTAVRIGPPGYARGITIRAMPTAEGTPTGRRTVRPGAAPLAPEPPALPGVLDAPEGVRAAPAR